MIYVVYHKESTQLIKQFNNLGGAKRSATCMNRNANGDVYAVAEEQFYHRNIVWRKKVKSLMTGEEVEIASNTPRCCDPSSELYWSM